AQLTCRAGVEGFADGATGADLATRRADSSLRSRRAICFARIHEPARRARNPSEHEPAWQSVRERAGGAIYAHPEGGGSTRTQLPERRGRKTSHGRGFRRDAQPPANDM